MTLQFATYLDYYREKLKIKMSLSVICLLITKDGSKNFGIAEIQTNNTFNIKSETFMKIEETAIIEAKCKAKT